MNKLRAALAALRARGAFDLLWVAGFAVCLTLLLMRPSVSAVTGKGVALELATGAQRRALYSGDTRVATIVERVARDGESWRVTQTLQLPGEDKAIGHIKLQLFKDLSLKRVDIDADLSKLPFIGKVDGALVKRATATLRDKLGDLFGAAIGQALPLLERLASGVGRVRIGGTCETHRGNCWLRGRIGKRPFGREVSVGRGPVLTSAIFPLLARGALGRRAELSIFDPLTLSTRMVVFSVGKRERIKLRSGEQRGLRVEQNAGLMRSTVWLDSRGHVLLETMGSAGLRVEHEGWIE